MPLKTKQTCLFQYAFISFIFLIYLTSKLHAAPINLTKLDVPQAAPDFLLIDFDNNIHSLNEYKGKPIIINFWATWCPPCRAELPSLNRAWSKIKNEGIQMLAINVGEPPSTVFDFIQHYPIDFKVLLDPESDQLDHWQMKGLPTTFILNSKGEVVYQAIGEREWDSDELLKRVLDLKAK